MPQYQKTSTETESNHDKVKAKPPKTRDGGGPTPLVGSGDGSCSRCGWKSCKCPEGRTGNPSLGSK